MSDFVNVHALMAPTATLIMLAPAIKRRTSLQVTTKELG